MRPAIEAVMLHMWDKLEKSKRVPLICAEVGCYEGGHAYDMLKTTHEDAIGELHLVDIAEFECIYERLSDYKDKTVFHIPMSSDEACKTFKDETFDFVYIDAEHTYEHSKHDCEIWSPKVKQNGILCGHDFSMQMLGTIRAVGEFAIENKLMLSYSVAYDPRTKLCSKSDWWVYKT